jgi:hypothetical protein
VSTFKVVQYATLLLLFLFAGLLLALVLGAGVPRWLMVAVLVAHTLGRSYRDLRWGGEARRRRVFPNLLLTAVVAYLILVAA